MKIRAVGSELFHADGWTDDNFSPKASRGNLRLNESLCKSKFVCLIN